jgi:hypothetical protein
VRRWISVETVSTNGAFDCCIRVVNLCMYILLSDCANYCAVLFVIRYCIYVVWLSL